MPAEVVFRPARLDDLPAILALLADDDIVRARGDYDALPEKAFAEIDADPRNELVVADESGTIVGTCQLTFIPGLSRGGAERMTIEAVRVHSDRRGAGIGRRMMAFALDRARARNCAIAQLTTDKRRTDAHRFYQSLGFVASHEGMKLALSTTRP